MTLDRLCYRVGELRKANGDRLVSDIKEFVNLGQTMIAEQCDWSFMRSHEDATIYSGDVSGIMPENFKRLTSEKSAVSYSDATVTGGFPIPVPVYSREQMENRGWWPLIQWNVGVTTFLPSFGVFIDIDGGIPTINIPQNIAATADLVFKISGYFYPADLVKASDHNAITDHGIISDALVNISKALAYESEDPTDPRAAACRVIYEKQIRTALYSDGTKDRGGRVMRM